MSRPRSVRRARHGSSIPRRARPLQRQPPVARAAARSARLTERSTTLPDLEKTFLVLTSADTAFDFLSDPIHLPEYVATVRLEESIAVEGGLDVDADLASRGGAPGAGFVADRATRHIEWGRPDRGYGGSIDVSEGTANTASVTVRLHTREDTDGDEVARVFDQAIANIRRALSGR